MSDFEPVNELPWDAREALAESIIPLVGSLHRNNQLELEIFGRGLLKLSPLEIIKVHRYARHVYGRELEIEKTVDVLNALVELSQSNLRLDIGRLIVQHEASGQGLFEYLAKHLAQARRIDSTAAVPVVLYGFGRIGRLLARILIAENAPGGLQLKAIVVRKGSDKDLDKRASLLRRDSVHGRFKGVIAVDHERNQIVANGNVIQIIYANSPAEVDYAQFGISNALLIDNTGIWRDEVGLGQHLKCKGIAKVLLTAPGKSPLKNIVYGINHKDILETDRILSAASCTTNAITPVLKVINDNFGLVHGHVETVHSYTNDQNLIDNFHKGDRRGRSAALNMVITETGAAKAVSKALPELEGKLTGNAIRVPTPNVSMAILNLEVASTVDRESVNQLLREVSLNSALHNQIDYIESPEVVSTDFVGSARAGIVDGLATIANGPRMVLYVWYDNEAGYSNQVIRVAKCALGLEREAFPPA